MGMWELIGLWLETSIINLCMWVLSIVIFVIVYGRMIEIYSRSVWHPYRFPQWQTVNGDRWGRTTFVPCSLWVSRVPDPGMRRDLRGAGPVDPSSGDIHGAIWGTAGYTVLLAFALFKTGSLSKSIFNSH